MSDESNTDTREIIFNEVMDISSVADIKAQLVEALESGQPVILDATQVERADTAALQVLGAFFHDAETRNQSIQWREPSESLGRSSTLLGLSELLHLTDTPH